QERPGVAEVPQTAPVARPPRVVDREPEADQARPGKETKPGQEAAAGSPAEAPFQAHGNADGAPCLYRGTLHARRKLAPRGVLQDNPRRSRRQQGVARAVYPREGQEVPPVDVKGCRAGFNEKPRRRLGNRQALLLRLRFTPPAHL